MNVVKMIVWGICLLGVPFVIGLVLNLDSLIKRIDAGGTKRTTMIGIVLLCLVILMFASGCLYLFY